MGDADRNRTADLLKEAHAAGYLTLEEADERLGTALAARTRGELDRWSPTCRPSGGPVRNGASGRPGRPRASASPSAKAARLVRRW